MIFGTVRGAFMKDAPRKPQDAGDKADYDYSELQKAVWLIEHPGRELKTGDSTVNAITADCLDEAGLLECISPAAAFMAKRYDCSDFRAIWLCKLRYALADSPEYKHLLTPNVDNAIKNALTGFKYWITSKGRDSMCYYSENHQMVFAVSEYLAGNAYRDDVFSIDGRTGREHKEIAAARMNNWFDQRGRYGFSEFLSSNYLAVDIGALSMLRTYCDEASDTESACNTDFAVKSELALDMIFLDYALQMYDCAFTAPAGRNYARNNTSFMASYASHTIVDKVWGTGETDLANHYGGFPYLFISLVDSGKYKVPEAIVSLGRDNNKGTVRTTSGLTLKEMQEKGIIGQSDYQLMFQLGMGALSNEEVIENTLDMLDGTDMSYNNFVSKFRYFNSTLLRKMGLTRAILRKLDPFSNGMAIERNEVYTYCCEDYKLSTDQACSFGSYGAQQIRQIACLPGRINVFTANPMRSKEFQGYGVAPRVAQNANCMLSVYNIPEGNIHFATGATRHYTSTYFPKEKFDEAFVGGCYAFGKIKDTYIAIIGGSPLKYEKYASEAEFEQKIFNDYNFYEGRTGADIDAFRLKDWTQGFDLRQEGNIQFTIYELSSGANETFTEFCDRVRANSVTFMDNVLTYTTKNVDFKSDITYVLNYSGTFTVNNTPVSTLHDRYDSAFVHAAREAETVRIEHGGVSCELNFGRMLMN